MPMSAPRPCAVPGCPGITRERYCEKHAAMPRQREYDRHRPNSAMRGFGRPWRRLREFILSRDPLCVNPFGIEGHVALSTDVDHILPVAQGGTEEPSNLQGLCHSCHSRKTATEVGFGGQAG